MVGDFLSRLSRRNAGLWLTALLGTAASAGDLRLGLAKRDITGTPTGRPMMGYGDPTQKTAGVHTRLWARALVVEKDNPSTADSSRVAIVVADLGMIFGSVSAAVIQRLATSAPGRYDATNVMLTATHTHSSPGGFSHYDLYNATTQGYDPRTFAAIVDGISGAILAADRDLQPGSLSFGEGELRGVAVNRSLPAYVLDPDRGPDETDPLHLVLRINDAKGQARGAFDWFAVHATSMSKHNHLISSDNKGYADWALEHRMQREGVANFLAAFGNSNEGDSSPDIFRGTPNDKGLTDEQKTELIGSLQADAAFELVRSAKAIEVPRVQSRHTWIRMPGYSVSAEYTRGSQENLCGPALGYSFAAGAEDGPSDIPGFVEGIRQGDHLPSQMFFEPLLVGLRLILGGSKVGEACHSPKAILISGGGTNPELLPETLPFQIFTLGPVAIAGVPAEMTTVSGQRLRALLEAKLAPLGVRRVVIAGLANEYSHYVATPEEYQSQQYEGGSTLFGPNTLNAHLQIFAGLAESLLPDEPVRAPASNGPPPARQKPLVDLLGTAPFDGRYLTEKAGQVLDNVDAHYRRGDVVSAAFRAGLPTGPEEAFVVERWDGMKWERQVGDGAPDANYEWKRDGVPFCIACSRLTAHWQTFESTPTGTYRIRHKGTWRDSPLSSERRYETLTRSFSLD